MENVLTSLSLTKDLEKKIKDLAQRRGQTKNSLIQEALRDFILRQELEPIERKMQAKARASGVETDEDVVELIHEVRRQKK